MRPWLKAVVAKANKGFKRICEDEEELHDPDFDDDRAARDVAAVGVEVLPETKPVTTIPNGFLAV